MDPKSIGRIRLLALQILYAGYVVTLSACGGGGGGGGDQDSPPPPTGVNTISDTTSPTYLRGLQAVAEVLKGFEFVMSLNDLVISAGQTGNCGQAGTASYNSGVQTLTNCVRSFPNDEAYNGTFNVTTSIAGSQTNVSVTGINNLKALNPTNLASQDYAIPNGFFTASNLNSSGSDSTKLLSGGATFYPGTSSSSSQYSLSNLNTTTVNNGSSYTVSQNSSSGFASVQRGTVTYDISIDSPITVTGNNLPGSGAMTVRYSTTTCNPLSISFISITKFAMACGGQSITKNWNDSDVLSARTLSRQ